MFLLRRLRLDSVGHLDSRFDPLQLNFCDGPGGLPLDTVVWLENGGGKTSLLALLFSVLQPSRNDFLGGRQPASQERRLADYVGDLDTAHVVAEWQSGVPGLPQLAAHTGGVLVTGEVMEWKQRRRSAADQDLRRVFYCFRSIPGALTLDDLPMREGGRRVPMAAFVDRLHDLAKRHPALELKVTTVQRDWLAVLSSVGLDPEIFRYQVRMNGDEGAAEEFLRFQSSDTFVDFLLRVVTDADSVAQVAGNLAQVSGRLAKRPELELERNFLAGATERLREVAGAEMRRQEAAQGLLGTLSGARARYWVLSSSAAAAAERQGAETAAAAQHAVEAEQRDRDRSQLSRYGSELRLVAAELRNKAVQEDAASAQRQRDACDLDVDAWEATGVMADLASAKSEAAALGRQLGERERGAAPLLLDLERAGATLRARLEYLAHESDELAAGEREASEAASEEARLGGERAQEAAGQAGEHRATARALGGQLSGLDSARRSLERQGRLAPGVSAADALTAAQAEDTTLEQEQREITATIQRLAADEVAAQAHKERLTGERARLATEAAGAADQAAALGRRVDSLSADSRLSDLAGRDEYDLLALAPGLRERLQSAAAAATRQVVSVEAESAGSKRAAAAVEESGLLPPTADVEAALAELESAGVRAVAGWRYLASSVSRSRWHLVLAQCPEVAGGIVVTDPSQWNLARELISRSALLPASAVVAAPSSVVADAESAAAGGQARSLFPPSPALMDTAAGAAERGRLLQVLEQSAAQRAELEALAARDRNLDAALASLMADLPHGGLRGLQDGAADLRGKADGCASQLAGAVERSAELSAARADAEVRLAEANRSRLSLASKVTALEAQAAAEADAVGWRVALDEAREAGLNADLERVAALAARGEAALKAERHAGACRSAESEAADLRRRAGGLTATPLTDAELTDLAPLDELEADYRSREDAYRRETSGSVLAFKHATAEARALDLQGKVDVLPQAVRDRAAELALTPSARTAERRASALREAKQQAAQAAEDLGTARSAAAAIAAELQAARPQDGGRHAALPDHLEPSDLADADRLATKVSEHQRQAGEAFAAATAAAAVSRDRAAGAARDATEYIGAQRLVGQPLADHGGPGEPLPVALEPPPPNVAVQFAEDAVAALKSAASVEQSHAAEVRVASEAVQRFAALPEYGALAGPARQRLLEAGGDRWAPEAARHLPDFEARLRVIGEDLERLVQDAQLVVTELAGVVAAAFANLQQAQRSSRLPDGLGDWSGHQFLELRFQRPESDVEMRAHLDRLVTELAASGQSPDGLGLLLAGVRAANRRPFEATVLKPNEALHPERVEVSQVAKFSGGQKLTTAILLYCTLVRLRARNRGQSDAEGAGVLVLDNPIGKANLVTLIELQRQVAQRMGVQLIFTTGVQDWGAVAALPNRIRLRNRSDRRTGRGHVTAEDSEPAPGGVEAAQVYRRRDAVVP